MKKRAHHVVSMRLISTGHDMLQPIARTGRPIARIDVAAAAGQFLAELSLADLVVELVQNDLDAGASRTMISFGDD
ncbi:hypothetical protein ACCT20_37525, partial [Rhizobium ruizarguesonis]